MYRGQGMGRADPSGMQYSIVGPEKGAKAQAFEPFGGQLPHIMREELARRHYFNNLADYHGYTNIAPP